MSIGASPEEHSAPRISVCIPAYNGKQYLHECISSVLAQTFHDFEVLIVDDASTDGTAAVAQEYAARDPRIRVSRNERNLGLVGNWNRCVELARGQWIKFVFQDDFIMPDCLRRMLEASAQGAALVACRRKFVFDDETAESDRRWYLAHASMIDRLLGQDPVLSAEHCQKLALEHIGENLFGEPTAVMLHRSVFSGFGGFNPALIMSCDLEYWTRVAIHTGAVYIPEELAAFRVHAGATSAANHAYREYRTQTLDALIILHDYIHNPHYEPVRRLASEATPPLDLERQFVNQCHEARAIATSVTGRERDADAVLFAEWQDVSRVYPRITMTNASHFVWRVRRRLRDVWKAGWRRGLDG